MIDRKQIREKIGYTRERQTTNAAAWFSLAESYRAAAEVLHECRERIPSDTRPFALNAGLSLELIFKAILAHRSLSIPDGAEGHDLPALAVKAELELTENQKITLELLTETIVWAGRYRGPEDRKAMGQRPRLQ